jgi:ABC-type glycerol-3-phosphate transport system substrate-binding protein
MPFKSNLFSTISPTKVLLLSSALVLAGCGGSDDSTSAGYVKFYHSSKNAPDIILMLDQNLESDDDDDTDNVEVTFNGIAYTEALSKFEIETNRYFDEMGWQDEDSSDRDDLALVAQGQLTVSTDTIQLLVLNDDITAAQVETYSFDVLEDDEDEDNDLFT